MKWFGKRRRGEETAQAAQAAQARQAVSELLDPYHDRASIEDGSQFVCNPGQVLDNVELAMERLDNDIDTPIGIEDDVASMDELHALLQQMAMGPTLISHVVDTAMRIMLARYPETLVRAPFPPEYDLRALVPVQTSRRMQCRPVLTYSRFLASARMRWALARQQRGGLSRRWPRVQARPDLGTHPLNSSTTSNTDTHSPML